MNAHMSAADIHEQISDKAGLTAMLNTAMVKQHLSARGVHKSIRVARTIADLDLSEQIKDIHLAEALSYRHYLTGMLHSG